MQLGWHLPLILNAHGQRALEVPSRIGNGLSNLALNNSVLRRVPHLELATRNLRGGNNFKIGEWHEFPDFQLAFTHNGQGRRLYPTDADHSSRALSQDDRCGAGEREVVNLVGLSTGYGGGVKAGIFSIWLCPAKCVADGLLILRGKQHPHDLAAVLVVLEDLLTYQLAFAVAVSRKP